MPGDVADYDAAVMPNFLPGMRDSSLSIVRCPDGVGTPVFFKSICSRTSSTVRSVRLKEPSEASADYLFVDRADGGIELV